MDKKRLEEYNKEILDAYYFEEGSQHIVMPGFFNGEILFIGQNPGLLKKDVEGDIKYFEAYNKRDLLGLKNAYAEALRSDKGTLGTFLIDLVGEDWSSLSFTNVIKTPFDNNDVKIKDLSVHAEVLKKQIEFLKPKYIFAIGKIASEALKLLNIQPTMELLHPSYLKRSGMYEEKVKEYSAAMEKLLFRYFVTNCDVRRHRDVYVRYVWRGARKIKMLRDYPFFFYMKNFNGKHTTYDGKKVEKMFFSDVPGSTGEEKKFFFQENKDDVYESDVYKNVKYIIEEKCNFSQNQKTFYFDIETNYSFDTINVPEPIITISGITNSGRTYVWAWREDIKKDERTINETSMKYFTKEKDMLKDFFLFMKTQHFDILTGWNSEVFDIPYLLHRAERLGLDLNLMSPYDETNFNIGLDRDSARFRIYGTNHIDLMKVYKKLTYDKRPESYSLGSVSKFMADSIDEEKHPELKEIFKTGKLGIGNISEAWKTKLDELIEYNIQDCRVLKAIDDYTHLLDFLKTLQGISSCPLDLCLFNKNVVDCYILKDYNGKYVFPDAKDYKRDEYEGAITGKLVFDDKGNFDSVAPVAGMFSNVAVPDFSSMYPSIYRTFNISPETIVDEGDVKIDGVQFTISKEGLIPSMFENLLAKRKEYEAVRDSFDRDSVDWYIYSNYQAGIKQIANSLYGLTGYPKFRLFDPRVAKTITYIGRHLIAFTWKELENMGVTPLYVDTDSVFVKFADDLSEEEIIQKCGEFELILNNRYKDFVKNFKTDDKCLLKIETEKIFKRIIFTGVKKKYIGKLFYKKGRRTEEIFGRGIELIKRDTPKAFKILLKNVVNQLINDDSNTLKYVQEFKKNLKASYSLQDIGISKTISKHLSDYQKTIPQHIRAVLYSNKNLGTTFMKADIPKLFYVNCSKDSKLKVIALTDEATELPPNFSIDWDKYFENFIEKKLEMFSSVKNLSSQKKLSDFLNRNV